MIVSVFGKCDGKDIIFKESAGGIWQCQVPPDFIDGTYIVEIFATDEAGNTTFMTNVLFSVDSATLAFEILYEQQYDLKILYERKYDIQRGWIDGREIYFG